MRTMFVSLALLAALGLQPGCASDVHGVEVNNQTDRIVRAELLQLRKDGEMHAYSIQTIAPEAEFKHKVAGEDRKRGMRVRFTLAAQTVADGNWVMLNLPDTRDRIYDLVLVGNHLSARDATKARKVRSAD